MNALLQVKRRNVMSLFGKRPPIRQKPQLRGFLFPNVFAFTRFARAGVGGLFGHFDGFAVQPPRAAARPVILGLEGPFDVWLRLDSPDLQAIGAVRVTDAYG